MLSAAGDERAFTISNTYEREKAELTAVKLWKDQDDAYHTRPGINSGALTFRFYRRAYGSSTAELLSGTTAWSLDSANSNRWICTFTPDADEKLYTFDPTATPTPITWRRRLPRPTARSTCPRTQT